ncbi:MAG: VOC family protein [Cytophagales bacterium]|nr:VOC family protein [Cytophagales bacterium]
MKRIVQSTFLVLAFSLIACNNEKEQKSEERKVDSNPKQIKIDMNSFVSLFEIPATDLSRAVSFYEEVLNIKIEKMEMPGMEMGIFPYEQQLVTGVIMKGEGFIPSADGPTIYLNAGDNLQPILDRVEKSGGKIVMPKTAHADESGFFALFLDTEGNRLGLNSPN